ncbi:hypothetical protein IP88_01520 [alpha proteobacterium AAP81b]|nr:hypothetical protein IP88_01520 [alpha proteobacterium AAP81b]
MRVLLLALAIAAPAAAEPALRLSGSAGVVNDYRFRGISRSDRRAAVQAGVTLDHRSGVYAGASVASVAGWGSFGGAGAEVDLLAGYRFALLGGDADAGLVWTLYPGGAADSDYAEIFARLAGTIGPLQLSGSASYAPPQRSLGRVFESGAAWVAGTLQRAGAGGDNLYLKAAATAGIPRTPVTLIAHVGHSWGTTGLGPNGRALTPTGEVWDWRLGADIVLGPVTLGVAWTDTSLNPASAAYQRLAPAFGGRNIAGSRGLVSLTANF